MSTPIKVLLATRPLVPPWDEASKNFAYFLAKSIRDPRIEFHLLTADEKLDELGPNCIQRPIFRSGRFNFEAKARLAAFLGTKGRSFDIVHFLFTPTPLNAFLAKNLVGTRPKTIQTIATLREERWNETDWKRMFFADKLITYTDHSKDTLESVGFRNVSRIYPGIDLDRYKNAPKNPKLLTELGIAPDDFVITYPGEYARLGATDMLVDMIIKNIRTGNPTGKTSGKIVFLFALRVKNDADRQKKIAVQRELREAGILDSVRFTDTISDMPSVYNLSDIVLFPVSDMHGKFDIPLVILEAYACEKPVILSDLPLFREFSNPEISATIPRGDGDALWDAIQRLRLDLEKRKALGRSARAFVERSFDLKKTAERYQDSFSRGFFPTSSSRSK